LKLLKNILLNKEGLKIT